MTAQGPNYGSEGARMRIHSGLPPGSGRANAFTDARSVEADLCRSKLGRGGPSGCVCHGQEGEEFLRDFRHFP